MKNFIVFVLISIFSVPVFASPDIPITPVDSDIMITSLRPATYTAGTLQCKMDKNLVKAIAADYYNAEFGKVEKWKNVIETTRQLTAEERSSYDYVKTVFLLERNTPKRTTWGVCDEAMKVFKENIDKQKDEYTNAISKIIEEYKSAQLITGNDRIQTFNSPIYNTTIAIINAKDIRKYQNELANYEYVIKVKSTNSISVMMKNNVVNKKMANFYGSPINSVSTLSLQKVYSAYVSEANKLAMLFGGAKAPVYPKSTKVGKIYFIEM